MRQTDVDLPSHLAMAWPTLVVMREAGRALTNSEIEKAVADHLNLDETPAAQTKVAEEHGKNTSWLSAGVVTNIAQEHGCHHESRTSHVDSHRVWQSHDARRGPTVHRSDVPDPR
jgi:hypothetical protein